MTRSVLLLGACALIAACAQPGQLVLGLATDLPARDQIDQVTMTVTRRGDTSPVIEHQWSLSGVPARDYRLPGSFNLFAEGKETPAFDVIVRGSLGGAPRVERRAALGITPEKDLFVRIALVARCEDLGCPPSLTCIEGYCRPGYVDLRALPAYRAQLVERVDCDSGTTFIDTSTHAPMPMGTGCGSNQVCGEGVCLADPATLPPADGEAPFLAEEGELFATTPPPGAFYPVGPLDAHRYHATATVLRAPDVPADQPVAGEERVLVVGGFGGPLGDAPPVAGALIYVPREGRFRRLPDPPAALGGHSATLLRDGQVLFVGSAGGAPSAFVFDPATEQWTTVASPSAARFYHSATLLLDGRVLIYGGVTGAQLTSATMPVRQAEVFDPVSRRFSMLPLPRTGRYGHAAATLPDNRVLFFGGIDGTGTVLDDVEAFDPMSNQFSAELAMSRPRTFHSATAIDGAGSVLLVGQAEVGLGEAELYVPGGIVTPPQPSAPPPTAHLAHLAVPLGGGRVLFLGGTDALGAPAPTASAFLYQWSAAGGTFTRLDDANIPRVFGFAAALASGEVLIGGGHGAAIDVADGGSGDPMDMTPATCDPLAAPGSNGCPGASPRCTVAGQSGFGPQLTGVGPRCVPDVPVAMQVATGMPCVPGDAAGKDDACVAGAVCLRDVALFADGGNSGDVCQPLCRSDVDCPPNLRCALLLNGAPELGVCIPGCTHPDTGQSCMTYPGSTCKLASNRASPAGARQATGVCLHDGTVPSGSSCTNLGLDSTCGGPNLCIAGTCLEICTPDVPCMIGTCTNLEATDPAGAGRNGYCALPPDMAATDL